MPRLLRSLKRPPTEGGLFYFRLHLPAVSASSAKRVHSSKCLSHDALLASSLASCASCNAAFAARRYFSDSVFMHSLYQGRAPRACMSLPNADGKANEAIRHAPAEIVPRAFADARGPASVEGPPSGGPTPKHHDLRLSTLQRYCPAVHCPR
jgi:hypothetical protein